MITEQMKYSVGALLYSPALNVKIADAIISSKFDKRYSLCLCLEDTIADDAVERALGQLEITFHTLQEAARARSLQLPKIFVRARNPEQVGEICRRLAPYGEILTGLVFPKYSSMTAGKYNQEFLKGMKELSQPICMMPILESADIVDYMTRWQSLKAIRKAIDDMRDYVLNVRVGGNDFCNIFGIRRHVNETIYDILPVGQLLCDILTVFSRDYVVSGPVWEYYAGKGDRWAIGLANELRRDMLNGFVGKTVIHPAQIRLVNEALAVSTEDYRDAREIMNWNAGKGLLVRGSAASERMNEVNTHRKWAAKIIMLAEQYGVRDKNIAMDEEERDILRTR